MRWRYLAVVVGASGLGTLLGWAVGSSRPPCEHSCPATGACPDPADCQIHTFNWTAALVVGLLVAAVVIIGVAVQNRRPVMRPGQPGPDCRY